MTKRLFDIFLSFFGLIASVPLFLIIAVLIERDSDGSIFYKAKRAGRFGKIFTMYKFRSMIVDADKIGGPSTAGDDPRLTRIGKKLRGYNLDELPQLINILKGDMSFVGPRPEVPSEIETYPQDVKEKILSVRPGLTDLASLINIHEEDILRGSPDPHKAYREKIQPEKIRLGLEYIGKRSFWLDIKIIIKTIISGIF